MQMILLCFSDKGKRYFQLSEAPKRWHPDVFNSAYNNIQSIIILMLKYTCLFKIAGTAVAKSTLFRQLRCLQ